MAQRQKPVTEPVLDNSACGEFPAESDNKIVLALPRDQFLSIILNIKNRPLDQVTPLLTHTFHALKRLGVSRDLDEAFPGVPAGHSTHLDFGTFMAWVDKITPAHKDAVAQLVVIDATAKVRVTS
jgi:hypothetical protein